MDLELVSAFAGSLELTVGLCPALVMQDILVVLRPREVSLPPAPSNAPAAPAAEGTAEAQAEAATMSEAIKLIAGGLESLWQRLGVEAKRVVIRVELLEPFPHHTIVLNLENAEYSGGNLQADSDAGMQQLHLGKTIRFCGLGVQLMETGNSNDLAGSCSALLTGVGQEPGCNGCGGLKWSCSDQEHARPLLSSRVHLEGLQFHVQPQAIAPVVSLVRSIARVRAAGCASPDKACSVENEGDGHAGATAWGSTSFMAFLPDGEGIVRDVLARPSGCTTGQASN